MVALKAHFDGKVIVPDEPVNLAPNQRLIIHIETMPSQSADFQTWIGLGTKTSENPHPKFPSDDDLWR